MKENECATRALGYAQAQSLKAIVPHNLAGLDGIFHGRGVFHRRLFPLREPLLQLARRFDHLAGTGVLELVQLAD